jgi:hypothetical protein
MTRRKSGRHLLFAVKPCASAVILIASHWFLAGHNASTFTCVPTGALCGDRDVNGLTECAMEKRTSSVGPGFKRRRSSSHVGIGCHIRLGRVFCNLFGHEAQTTLIVPSHVQSPVLSSNRRPLQIAWAFVMMIISVVANMLAKKGGNCSGSTPFRNQSLARVRSPEFAGCASELCDLAAL